MKTFHWELSCSAGTNRQTDERTDGQLDLSKLIVAFPYYAQVPESNLLMLYKEIITVVSLIRAKPINTLCNQEQHRVV